MSYILPKDEHTLAEMKTFRSQAQEAGIRRAVTLGIGGGREELNVRQAQNIFDFGTALEQWNTAALAVVGNQYSCFQAIAAPVLAANRLVVFYGCAITTAPVPVSRLTFRSGGAAGNIIAEFDLERIINAETVEGYFGQPICIDPTMTFAAQVTCAIATGVLAEVVLWNWLVEPIGQVIA